MNNNPVLLPGSGGSAVSTSSLNMVDSQTYFHGNSTDAMNGETKVQPLGVNNMSEAGESSGSGSKVKSGKKGDKQIEKHRYAFQTRSKVDILDDGYRWRKYGQKGVKNSKYPRSYYKCTHKGCNVKKQIQRRTKDEEIVVTTYEGIHTHPLEKTPDSFEHIFRQMQTYAPG